MNQSLINTSESLMSVLLGLSESDYKKSILLLDKHSIGQHYRHIIEHWKILIDQYESKTIDYSNRERNKDIESSKNLAMELLGYLQDASNMENSTLTIYPIDETKEAYLSSYYRELDVITEHIIHHSAILKMAILSIRPNFIFPEGFGYAPSTISFRKECVQ